MSIDILNVKLEALHTDVGEIKTALDKVSDAITKLALVEQQQSQIAASLERAFGAIGKLEDRLSKIEQAQPLQNKAADWVDRGVIALAGAAIVLIAKAAGIG